MCSASLTTLTTLTCTRLKSLLGGDSEIKRLGQARDTARDKLSAAQSDADRQAALAEITDADNALTQATADTASKAMLAMKLLESERMMGELTNDWQHKWQSTTTILERGGLELKESGASVVVESELPHFIGLQLDDALSSGWTSG